MDSIQAVCPIWPMPRSESVPSMWIKRSTKGQKLNMDQISLGIGRLQICQRPRPLSTANLLHAFSTPWHCLKPSVSGQLGHDKFKLHTAYNATITSPHGFDFLTRIGAVTSYKPERFRICKFQAVNPQLGTQSPQFRPSKVAILRKVSASQKLKKTEESSYQQRQKHSGNNPKRYAHGCNMFSL